MLCYLVPHKWMHATALKQRKTLKGREYLKCATKNYDPLTKSKQFGAEMNFNKVTTAVEKCQ